jgi:YidC/Oxa1 family membrane protein insertase
MFNTLIVQPLFNLLVFIYALIPGHNFGLALIIFTIIIRLLLWPLVRKQLHQAKAMRSLQPELKKIKAATKGNRQKESMMLMELYKERGINPFATFPVLIVQFIVLIGLYYGLLKIIKNPESLVDFAYPFIQNMGWMQSLAENIHRFDNTLFGVVDLGRAALNSGSGIYWPAMLIVVGSAVAQYYQAKQLMPNDKDQRSLRAILKEAGTGKQADQSEVNAAVGRSMRYLIPVMIFVFTVNIASALSLYWLVGGLVAFIQQSIVLRRDETEMEGLANKPARKNVAAIPEAEVVAAKPAKKAKKSPNKTSKSKAKAAKKRRK